MARRARSSAPTGRCRRRWRRRSRREPRARRGSGGLEHLLEHPEALAALGLAPAEQLAVDLAHAGGRDRLGRVDILDLEARLVLVEVLARQPRAVVVGPDEGLAARDVVERIVALDVVADRPEPLAGRELVEGDLVADAPVGDREAVVGVPQHGVSDAVVEGDHAVLALDDRRARAPGDAVYGVVDHHVRRDDLLELARALE